jgi:hypothetical protein
LGPLVMFIAWLPVTLQHAISDHERDPLKQ